MSKKKLKSEIALKRGKRYAQAVLGLDKSEVRPLAEGIEQLKSRSNVKFDEVLEVAVNLGIDTKDSSQNVRGSVQMPNGLGKKVLVAVFVKDELKQQALDFGADIVGNDDLVEQIQKGEIKFDRCITTPDMMVKVSKVAKILGPRGLMPNPKLGTVTTNIEKAIKDAKAGTVDFRAEKSGIVHAGVGKLSFGEHELLSNVVSLYEAIQKARPSGVKGAYVKKISISSTMGPSFVVDLAEFKKDK